MSKIRTSRKLPSGSAGWTDAAKAHYLKTGERPSLIAAEAPKLAPIYKTADMRAIEAQHDGRDIRLILKDLYERLGSQRAVADALNLKESTISIWASRLGVNFTSRPLAEITEIERVTVAA